jgi:hypothetical protein
VIEKRSLSTLRVTQLVPLKKNMTANDFPERLEVAGGTEKFAVEEVSVHLTNARTKAQAEEQTQNKRPGRSLVSEGKKQPTKSRPKTKPKEEEIKEEEVKEGELAEESKAENPRAKAHRQDPEQQQHAKGLCPLNPVGLETGSLRPQALDQQSGDQGEKHGREKDEESRHTRDRFLEDLRAISSGVM